MDWSDDRIGSAARGENPTVVRRARRGDGAGVRLASRCLRVVAILALCVYVLALLVFVVSVFASSAAWLPPISVGIVIVSVVLFFSIVIPLSMSVTRGYRPDALLRAAMSGWWAEQPAKTRALTLAALGTAVILAVTSILAAPQHAGLVQTHGGYFLTTDAGMQAVSQSRYLWLSVARYAWSPLSAALVLSTAVMTLSRALRFRLNRGR